MGRLFVRCAHERRREEVWIRLRKTVSALRRFAGTFTSLKTPTTILCSLSDLLPSKHAVKTKTFYFYDNFCINYLIMCRVFRFEESNATTLRVLLTQDVNLLKLERSLLVQVVCKSTVAYPMGLASFCCSHIKFDVPTATPFTHYGHTGSPIQDTRSIPKFQIE